MNDKEAEVLELRTCQTHSNTYFEYQEGAPKVGSGNVQHHACLNQLYGQKSFQGPSHYLRVSVDNINLVHEYKNYMLGSYLLKAGTYSRMNKWNRGKE